MSYKYSDLTEDIIGAFYDVYNSLGYGFLERVYENALRIELEHRGFFVEQQKPIHVYYRNQLELKAARAIHKNHEAQLLNYLKATQYEVSLLLNFDPMPKAVRKAFDNHNKPHLSNGTT